MIFSEMSFSAKQQVFVLIKLISSSKLTIHFNRSRLRPPLWSDGQSSWLQIQRSRFRFSLLPDFLRSSGSGTGSAQPREYDWGTT
jgi:hypothetical protein